MSTHRRRVALFGAVLALAPSCDLAERIDAGCPTSVDEAAESEWGDAIVGGGYAIRFIPSTQLEFRGYEINLTRPLSERARMETYFLRIQEEIPGVAAGDPVLFIGARTDRAHVLVSGACPALTVTTDDDVSWEKN